MRLTAQPSEIQIKETSTGALPNHIGAEGKRQPCTLILFIQNSDVLCIMEF